MFLISKLPHNVLRPPAARSSDNWLNMVVFPEPVGPVKTVSSPRLSPLIIFVKHGKDFNAVPLYSSGCWEGQRDEVGEQNRGQKATKVTW